MGTIKPSAGRTAVNRKVLPCRLLPLSPVPGCVLVCWCSCVRVWWWCGVPMPIAGVAISLDCATAHPLRTPRNRTTCELPADRPRGGTQTPPPMRCRGSCPDGGASARFDLIA